MHWRGLLQHAPASVRPCEIEDANHVSDIGLHSSGEARRGVRQPLRASVRSMEHPKHTALGGEVLFITQSALAAVPPTAGLAPGPGRDTAGRLVQRVQRAGHSSADHRQHLS
jgi:hypothetical protein